MLGYCGLDWITQNINFVGSSRHAIQGYYSLEVNCNRVHQKSESWTWVVRLYFCYPQSSGKNPLNPVLMTSFLCNFFHEPIFISTMMNLLVAVEIHKSSDQARKSVAFVESIMCYTCSSSNLWRMCSNILETLSVFYFNLHFVFIIFASQLPEGSSLYFFLKNTSDMEWWS